MRAILRGTGGSPVQQDDVAGVVPGQEVLQGVPAATHTDHDVLLFEQPDKVDATSDAVSSL